MTVTFLSLGTVLIDHFKYVSEGSTRDEKHPGGGGLFACAGARVWLRPEEIRVPVSGKKNEEMISQLLQLSSGSEKMWIWDDEGDMLEALTEYRGSERSFRYLNPRPPKALSSYSKLQAKYVHLCCDTTTLSASLDSERSPDQIIVYEPIPSVCDPSHFDAVKGLLSRITIFSPNHEEAATLLSNHIQHSVGVDSATVSVETLAETFAALGGRTIVIRAGSRGCYILNSNPLFGLIQGKWIPAYWHEDEALAQVQSTTGAGNSFLGGLCAGLELTASDIFMSAVYGSVSASFIVQQEGLPLSSFDDKGSELWNGELPTARLERLITDTISILPAGLSN